MHFSPPVGITPPSPGLEREEPELMMHEEDIPSDDGDARETVAVAEELDGLRHVERE